MNGLALLHQLAQSLDFQLEVKETVTSGKLPQHMSTLKILPLQYILVSLRTKMTCGLYTFLEY